MTTVNTTDQCDLDTLIQYLDDDLSPERRQKVDGHLQVCSSCRGELTELQGVVGLTQRLETPGMDRFQTEALVYRVRRGVQQRYTRVGGRDTWATALGSAAAGALALFLVLVAFERISPAGESASGRGLAMVPPKASLRGADAAVVGGSAAESRMIIAEDSSGIEVDPMSDESDVETAELISGIDEFLMDTASDEELLAQMSLIEEEALLALLAEY